MSTDPKQNPQIDCHTPQQPQKIPYEFTLYAAEGGLKACGRITAMVPGGMNVSEEFYSKEIGLKLLKSAIKRGVFPEKDTLILERALKSSSLPETCSEPVKIVVDFVPYAPSYSAPSTDEVLSELPPDDSKPRHFRMKLEKCESCVAHLHLSMNGKPLIMARDIISPKVAMMKLEEWVLKYNLSEEEYSAMTDSLPFPT